MKSIYFQTQKVIYYEKKHQQFCCKIDIRQICVTLQKSHALFRPWQHDFANIFFTKKCCSIFIYGRLIQCYCWTCLHHIHYNITTHMLCEVIFWNLWLEYQLYHFLCNVYDSSAILLKRDTFSKSFFWCVQTI